VDTASFNSFAGRKAIFLLAVREKVGALLAADTDSLTPHDIAAEATWADKLRESREKGVRQRTHRWHLVDIEIGAPNLDQACFGHPHLSARTPASKGPAEDSAVDKIDQFAAELANPATGSEEQIVQRPFHPRVPSRQHT
jgi:hypothetical protein